MTDITAGSAQEASKQTEQQDNVFSGEKAAEAQENTFSGENEADGSFNGNRKGKEKEKAEKFEYGKAIDLGGDTNAADFFINQIMTLNLFSQVMSRIGPNIELISRVASCATEPLQAIRDKLRERKLKKELYAPVKPPKDKEAEDKKQKKNKEKENPKHNKKKKNLKQHGQEAQNRKKEKERVETGAKRKSNVRAGSKQRVSGLKDLKKMIMRTNDRANQNTRTNQNNHNRAPVSREGRN